MSQVREKDRVCAGCGYYKRIYFQFKDPNRSLCCVCYADPELHNKYGKGYRGPILDPPHPQVKIVNQQIMERPKPKGPILVYEPPIPGGSGEWYDQYKEKYGKGET